MTLPVIKFKINGADAKVPTRAYPDDAGYDLYTWGNTVVMPGRFTDIPCGVSAELPEGTWGMLTGRSSTLRKRGLLVNQAVLDGGYRGPLFAGVWNLTGEPVLVREGERVAQLIVVPLVAGLRSEVVEALGAHPRGVNGFGSSGV